MAPNSSTLAWQIPWTEEPGRQQSMGSLGVGHNWATSLSLFTFVHWRRKWQPTPVFLPGESHGQRSLAGYSPQRHKSQTRLSTIFLSFFLKVWSEDSWGTWNTFRRFMKFLFQLPGCMGSTFPYISTKICSNEADKRPHLSSIKSNIKGKNATLLMIFVFKKLI